MTFAWNVHASLDCWVKVSSSVSNLCSFWWWIDNGPSSTGAPNPPRATYILAGGGPFPIPNILATAVVAGQAQTFTTAGGFYAAPLAFGYGHSESAPIATPATLSYVSNSAGSFTAPIIMQGGATSHIASCTG